MDKQKWNGIIEKFPAPQLLQTWEWGEVKSKFGWKPYYKVWEDEAGEVAAAALVLERVINLPGMAPSLRMHYTPKGPLLKDWEDRSLRQRVLGDLKKFAKNKGAFFLKVDPDVPLGLGEPGSDEEVEGLAGSSWTSDLKKGGWIFAREQVQFRNTVILDLAPTEEELLAQMKQKTRYNVRLADRKGVVVREGDSGDFGMLFKMYGETAVRDGFAIRGQEYYQAVWQTFLDAGTLTPLIAEVEGEPVAGLMLVSFGSRAWYLYGMSRPLHRNKMPTYLLQWKAIQKAKELGCQEYDLWGAPDEFDESQSMWGVYRFKRGLGGRVVRHIGAWDYPVRPWLYRMYSIVVPKLMGILRRRGNAQTRKLVADD